ncbi:ABC transporter permease [Paenibacillus thermotolerans]|uniref:ABC transporter permease n=1 Tax=Paenibacillus thermotolerans TaxID=3027807 RepID=UPI002368C6B0|nr:MULTISPECIES: ABC transporter permease [unclassified Paenibacillus]
MLNLIANENMKIFFRLRTWVIVAILIAATVGITAVLKMETSLRGDWKESLRQEIGSLEKQLASPDVPQLQKEESERSIALKTYALEHDINPNSMWQSVMNISGMLQIITIFVVIIAADMVAGEYTWGTIKLLLIRPVSRGGILLSKYAAMLLFALFLMAVLFGSAFAASGLLIGFDSMGTPYLFFGGDGSVQEGSAIQHAVSTYALQAIELIMVVTIAFMISTVSRSSSMAIAFSIFIVFAGQMTADMLLANFSWGKYFLFANTDLTGMMKGVPRYEGMTLPFSIAVLAVHFILFNLVSWLVFTRRDVSA